MKKLSSIFILAIILVSCGDADEDNSQPDNTDPSLSAQEEACLHILEGPFATTTSALEIGDVDSNINQPHHSYTVTLVENTEGEFQGAVQYNATDDEAHAIFTNIDIDVAVFTEQQDPLQVTTSEVDECIEVARQHTVELTEGPHFVVFGPTSQSEVSVIVEHLEELD